MTSGNSWRNACRAMKEKTSQKRTEADKFRRRAVTVAEDIGCFWADQAHQVWGYL